MRMSGSDTPTIAGHRISDSFPASITSMSVAADDRRSSDRATSYLFRMSHDDKQRLTHRARDAGMTIQGYLEHVVLGYEAAPPRQPGRRPTRHSREIQEDLGISA